jgi:TP901 family phage tail tape measure protein
LVIRARDVASRTIQQIGTNFGLLDKEVKIFGHNAMKVGMAMTAVGAGIGAIGAGALGFFNSATNASMEYSRAAALTRTQVTELGTSVKEIGEIGKRVARIIPAPFDQMQDALYDIFSSTNASVKEAEQLLALFAKGAVAGQTDVRTAARSTISVMNAYHMPFTKANDVMDIMFEMVRRGVGTYEEFNLSIGRAIPAAVSASQKFETLAGVMAFLTRQGLSTQMAATSAARAMELFTKPDVVNALRDIGVEVTDAQGNFRQLNDIILDLANSEGWAKMGAAERKEMFQKIFGQGTIQARRFFDTAIPNFRDLNTLTDITAGATGELNKAFQTMAEEPAMKVQLLKNRMEILRVEIGDRLVPAKLALMEVVTKLLDAWDRLSPRTQDLIIKGAALTATFMTLSGVVLVLGGVFLMFAALVAGAANAFILLGGIPLLLMGLVAIAVLIVKNWEWVKENLEKVFAILAAGLVGLAGALYGLGVAVNSTVAIWVATVAAPILLVVAAIAALVAVTILIIKHWDKIKGVAMAVVDAFKAAWQWFTNLSLAGKILVGILVAIIAPWLLFIGAVVAIVKNFGTLIDAVKGVWEWFTNLHMVGKVLVGIITVLIAPITALVAVGVAIVKNWSTLVQWGKNLVDALMGVVDWFKGLDKIIHIIIGVMAALVFPFIAVIGVVVGLGVAIYKHFNTIKDIVVAVWSVVVDAVDKAWEIFKNFWDWVTNIDLNVWGTIADAAVTTFDALKEAAQTVWDALKKFGGWLETGFSAAFDGVKTALDTLIGWFETARDWFQDTLGPGISEVWEALSKAWNDVTEEIKETTDAFVNYWNAVWGFFDTPVLAVARFLERTWNALWGFFDTPVRFAMDKILEIISVAWNLIVDLIGAEVKLVLAVVKGGFELVVGVVKTVWPIIELIITTVLAHIVTFVKISFEAMRITVTTIIGVIRIAIETALEIIMNTWEFVWDFLKTYLKSTWDAFITIIKNVIAIISNIIQFFLNILQGDWGEAWDNIKTIFVSIWNIMLAQLKLIWNIIFSLVKNAINIVWQVLQAGMNAIRALWDLGWKTVTNLLKFAWDSIKQLVKLGIDFLKNTLNTGLTVIKNAWNTAWTLVKNAAKAAWDWVKSQAVAFKDAIVGTFNTLKDKLHSIWRAIRDTAKNVWEGVKTAIKNAINGVIGLVNKLIGGINTVLGLIPGLNIKIPTIPRLESGGTLPAGAGQRIGAGLPTLATGGRIGGGFLTNKPMAIVGEGKTNYPEYVIPTDPRHRRNAFMLYDQLGNQLEIPGMQFGGLVDAFKKGTGFVGGLVSKGVGALGGLVRNVLTKAFDPIARAVIDQLGNLPNVFYLPKIAKGVAKAIWEWVKGADKGLPIEDRGGGTARGAGFGGLQPGFAAQIKQLIGMYGGYLVSGWRSSASQTNLYNAYLARGKAPPIVARPGTSMHERGLAADMSRPYGALSVAAHKLGLKAPVPGEPWHWQPGWTTNRSLYARGGILRYASGAWEIPQDQMANMHRGEMVIPQTFADAIRGLVTAAPKPDSSPLIHKDLQLLLQETKRHADINFAGHSLTLASLRTIRFILQPVSRQVLDKMLSPAEVMKRTIGIPKAVGRQHGLWKALNDELAFIHRGEMVVPARPAAMLRQEYAGMDNSGRGATFVFEGPVTFGSDMYRATEDLDWWVRAKTSGV